ncbi:hypothetical protein [Alienimonas chondri]|uniref:GHMP kinase N-terminal domain-containing protein n=1 Tax=Alienimonas chondri TaxID=2681879 RepID=A0ABX1V8T1_9PLAN|nr:hypothetical protein [Alienimonas chondri]NNJ24522.1 hypothetical protein [Alienimonas chondri]
MTLPLRESVTVTAGARLHFGLCALAPEWSGAGVTIEAPVTRVTVSRTDGKAEFLAVESEVDRLRAAAVEIAGDRPLRAELLTSPPAHSGLGSGTQIALAAATATARLFGEPDPIAGPLFESLGRANRSRLGAAGFQSGGMLLDPQGAVAAAHGTGVRSVALPAEWRWVVVIPKQGGGMTGSEEAAALRRMPEMTRPFSGGLRRMVLQSLPIAAGLGETPPDPVLFARVLADYGMRVGKHFAPLQGGVFASPAIREWAADRKDRNLPPPAQSSWGPTACAVFGHSDVAEAEARRVRQLLGDEVKVLVTATRNRGATFKER